MLHLICKLGTREAPSWVAAMALLVIASDAAYLSLSSQTSGIGSLLLLALVGACIVMTRSLLRRLREVHAASLPNGGCDFRITSLALSDDAGPLHGLGGSSMKQVVSRRSTKLFGAAFAVAAAVFWVTMLTSPPVSVAAASPTAVASAESACMVTLMGDIASCTSRN
jgi:hypothetical protein